MIVNSGLGDDPSDFPDSDSGNSWTLYLGIGIATFLALQILGVKKSKRTISLRERTKVRKSKVKSSSKRVSMSRDETDAIEALISQGASKSQAKSAVARAKANGATSFESLFRGALKQL